MTFPDEILKCVQSQSPEKLLMRLTSDVYCTECCKHALKPMKISLLIRKLKRCANQYEMRDIGVSYVELAQFIGTCQKQ